MAGTRLGSGREQGGTEHTCGGVFRAGGGKGCSSCAASGLGTGGGEGGACC